MKATFKIGKLNIKGIEVENIEVSAEYSISELRGLCDIAKNTIEYMEQKEKEDKEKSLITHAVLNSGIECKRLDDGIMRLFRVL